MKIALLGDIALVGKYDLASDDAVGRVQSVADELAQYDFVVANLESPMTEIRRSRVPKSLHIRTSPASVELLEALHVNAVTLANNHIHDFGDQGMLDTIDVLERHSIDWYGLNGRSLLKEIGGEVHHPEPTAVNWFRYGLAFHTVISLGCIALQDIVTLRGVERNEFTNGRTCLFIWVIPSRQQEMRVR